MTTTTTLQDRINAAAAGLESTVAIYWDDQDPQNAGPAYRDGTAPHGTSGELDFAGWSSDDCDGYELDHYFDNDGSYIGPDAGGVHPLFAE